MPCVAFGAIIYTSASTVASYRIDGRLALEWGDQRCMWIASDLAPESQHCVHMRADAIVVISCGASDLLESASADSVHVCGYATHEPACAHALCERPLYPWYKSISRLTQLTRSSGGEADRNCGSVSWKRPLCKSAFRRTGGCMPPREKVPAFTMISL